MMRSKFLLSVLSHANSSATFGLSDCLGGVIVGFPLARSGQDLRSEAKAPGTNEFPFKELTLRLMGERSAVAPELSS